MLFVILYEVADDQIGIHQPSPGAHRVPARLRAALVAASRISPKLIFLPFLLASTPLSARVPGCTRIVAWSPSTMYSSLSPDRKSTRLNSSHRCISYAVFCLKKKKRHSE